MRFLLPLLMAALLPGQEYDLVILGGHVMDPESGLDAVRIIGIQGGKIAVVTGKPLRGKQAVNAAGLIVSPGFIDIHSHGQDDENYRYKARDGASGRRRNPQAQLWEERHALVKAPG